METTFSPKFPVTIQRTGSAYGTLDNIPERDFGALCGVAADGFDPEAFDYTKWHSAAYPDA